MQQGYPLSIWMRAALRMRTFALMEKRTNVIGALYEKMFFVLDYFEDNINSSIFYDSCKQILIPILKTKCVIVMDMREDKAKYCFAQAHDGSCARVTRFHKSRCIQKLMNRHSHRIL